MVPLQQDRAGTPCRSGGGIHKVIVGVHLDMGVLRLPHRVSAHGIEQLVNGGRLRGQMKSLSEGSWRRSSLHQVVAHAVPPR